MYSFYFTLFSFLLFLQAFQFSSVAQPCLTLCDPMNHSTPGLPVHHRSWSLPKLMSIESVMPSSHLILCHPLPLLPPIPPSIRVFPKESTLPWGGQTIGVSASASVLWMNTQDWSPLEWTGLDLLAVQGTFKSSPTPQFKSINSLVLSFLHSLTLTSIHNHWKNHSLD